MVFFQMVLKRDKLRYPIILSVYVDHSQLKLASGFVI